MLHSGIYTIHMYTNAAMCEYAPCTKSNKRQSFTTHIKIGEMCVCMSKYEKNAWSLIHLTNIKNVWEKEIRIIYVNERGNVQQSLFHIFACLYRARAILNQDANWTEGQCLVFSYPFRFFQIDISFDYYLNQQFLIIILHISKTLNNAKSYSIFAWCFDFWMKFLIQHTYNQSGLYWLEWKLSFTSI